QAAADRDPRNTQPLEAWAKVRDAMGDHAGALQVCGRIVAIAEDPNSQYYALDGMTDPIPAGCYEMLGRDAEGRGDLPKAIRQYRAGPERLRGGREERPWRSPVRAAGGESASGREQEFQQTEVRLWDRLAALSARAGHAAEAAAARREKVAASKAAD